MRNPSPRAVICIAPLLLTLAVAATAMAQQTAGPYTDSRTIPDTLAYKRAREIVDLINAGDAAASEAYFRKNFTEQYLSSGPMSEHTGFLEAVRSANGGLEIIAARSIDPPEPPTHAVLIVRGKVSEAWRAIVVDVEEAPPHKVVMFIVAPARPPSDLPKG